MTQPKTDAERDAGAPPQDNREFGVHYERTDTAKVTGATRQPGGAAPADIASKGMVPAETNQAQNAWAARESKTGMKAGAVNAVATLSEGPLVVLGTPWGDKIRSFAPTTDTELSQNVAAGTEFAIVTAVSIAGEAFTERVVTAPESSKPVVAGPPEPGIANPTQNIQAGMQSDVKPDVPLHQIVPIGKDKVAPKIGTYRGITDKDRAEANRIGNKYGPPGEYDVGHRVPLKTLPPGAPVQLRAEAPAQNRSEGAAIREAAKWRKAEDLYVRPTRRN